MCGVEIKNVVQTRVSSPSMLIGFRRLFFDSVENRLKDGQHESLGWFLSTKIEDHRGIPT
jgi:hypothetical protein